MGSKMSEELDKFSEGISFSNAGIATPEERNFAISRQLLLAERAAGKQEQ